MTNAILDVSNFVWTEGDEPVYGTASVLVVMDFAHSYEDRPERTGRTSDSEHYFLICCGDFLIADCTSEFCPIYLALHRPDGGYRLERAERYRERRELGDRGENLILDLLRLPDQIGGITLHRNAKNAVYPKSNHWRPDDFRLEDDGQGTPTSNEQDSTVMTNHTQEKETGT